MRRIPNSGIGYGLNRYLGDKEAGAEPDILFNYLGQFERTLPQSNLFQLDRPLQAGYGHENGRTHALEINAYVLGGSLQLEWLFNPDQLPVEQITQLADRFQAELVGLIDHCLQKEGREFTPSDFDLAGLNEAEFARVAALLGPAGLANTVDIYPLTPTQAGILYHTLRTPDSEIYFEQISCAFTGHLQLEKFKQAWQRLADRHPLLRTRFLWSQLETPLQIVGRELDFPWEELDWRDRPVAEIPAALEALKAEYRQAGFDLAQGPLLRFAIVHTVEKSYFIWNTHHVLLDGWSTHQLFNEALTIYEALLRDTPPALPAVRPFRDHIGWLQQQDEGAAEAFWRRHLAGFDEATPLQVDKRTVAEQVSYGQKSRLISPADSAALTGLAQRERLTLNTIIQGSWGLLLSRYSGNEEVLFGTTVSGRPADLPHVEQMVGMFINTLPLRLHLTPNRQLLDWLDEVQAQHLEARQFEYSSLADVQSWSEIPAGQPLFDAILVFENYPTMPADPERSLQVSELEYREQSNYPLALLIVPGAQIELLAIYNRDRFDDEVIDRLLGHLNELLAAIAARPQSELGELPMLAPAEQKQILVDFNQTAQPGYEGALLHELISAHADTNPYGIAVQGDGVRLSYAELERQANGLAHYLLAQGIGLGDFVGLYTDRRPELLVGILATLKAGAAYVPIDPEYPDERIAYILADSGLKLLLTAGGEAPAGVAALDLLAFDFAAFPAEPPAVATTPAALAYVIYTSGSTGQPKGVMVNHGNIVHSTTARYSFYETPVERFLLLSSFSFDSSLVGIFWTLCGGGTLILPPAGLHQNIRFPAGHHRKRGGDPSAGAAIALPDPVG